MVENKHRVPIQTIVDKFLETIVDKFIEGKDMDSTRLKDVYQHVAEALRVEALGVETRKLVKAAASVVAENIQKKQNLNLKKKKQKRPQRQGRTGPGRITFTKVPNMPPVTMSGRPPSPWQEGYRFLECAPHGRNQKASKEYGPITKEEHDRVMPAGEA